VQFQIEADTRRETNGSSKSEGHVLEWQRGTVYYKPFVTRLRNGSASLLSRVARSDWSARAMTIEIKRCFFWTDIKAEAVSLKNNIERELGVPIRLRAGAPGSFSVLLNGEQIYSKKQAGRSPNAAEIIKLIHEKTPEP
jgi:predicted Rdx family selenoprotein